MKTKTNTAILVLIFGVSALVAHAQFSSGFAISSGQTTVKNAPFSAETKTRSVKTLADGNTITKTSETKIFRDSEGRTRTEKNENPDRYFGIMEDVTIYDPTAGITYYLNSRTKTYRKFEPVTSVTYRLNKPTKNLPKLESKPVIVAPTQPWILELQANMTKGYSSKTETLPDDQVEGLPCTVKKTTKTTAAGTIGNAREMVSTSETCFSNDLQVFLYRKTVDPEDGVITFETKNINRREPEKSLFTVPADYKPINSVANNLFAPKK